MEKVKKVFLSCVSGANFDDTILDYIVGLLQDESMNGEDAIAMLTPYLIDAGAAQDDAEAENVCKIIFAKLSSEGVTSHFSPNNPTLPEATPAKSGNALKVLAAPVNLSKGISHIKLDDSTFDWMKRDEKPTLLDNSKLEALEAKREKKKEKKQKLEASKQTKVIEPALRKSIHPEASSLGKPRDIKLENFSISHGREVLMEDCNITLAYDRKYGLVGRNGSGKSTLLTAIANRELDGIPSHLRILHVEQEVVGDETTVLESVLEIDVERTDLLAAEKELLNLTNDPSYSDPTLPFQLKKIHSRLSEIDAHTAEARASTILAGLSFTPEMQKRPTSEYSGGWRMRIALARALFSKPDVLLLDEPTNHLDLYSLLWLEDYLAKWVGTILVVSHQREFLNSVATDIVHLTNKKLDVYKGNYDAFEKIRDDRLKVQQKAFESQQSKKKHIQAFIDRFRYNANRAALVQSRIKALDRMEVIDEVSKDPTVILQFPDPDPLSPPVLQFRDVSFGFTSDNILFRDLNIGIDMESRVALVGANGAGKSTLMNLMAGELQATNGIVLRNPKLRFARFSQHFVDQLDLTISPLEHFNNTFPGLSIQTVRAHLGSFGLSGDIVLRTINTMSGGQKSRLVLSVLAWKKPQVLLLDEPTNHLDIETIDALAKALLQFKGGVLMVSHDERLITLSCDTLWYLADGTVTIFDGDFESYKKMLLKKMTDEKTGAISL